MVSQLTVTSERISMFSVPKYCMSYITACIIKYFFGLLSQACTVTDVCALIQETASENWIAASRFFKHLQFLF